MRTRLLLLLLCFIGLLTSCQREKETRVTDFVDPSALPVRDIVSPGQPSRLVVSNLVRIIQEVAGSGVPVIITAIVLYPRFPIRT